MRRRETGGSPGGESRRGARWGDDRFGSRRPDRRAKEADRGFRLLGAWLLLASLSVAAEPPLSGTSTLPLTAAASDLSNAEPKSVGEEEIRIEVLEAGSSTWRIRRTATSELPLERLSPEARRLVDEVLNSLSLHRRLPVVECEADPRVLRFFLDHPEVAVGIWRAMDISDLQLRPIAPGRYASDCGDGTTGEITVLYADERSRLIHCQGLFKSSVLPRPIQAAAVMHFRADYSPPEAARPTARCCIDVFVSFPSTTVETAARVISPVSNRIADRNFQEVALFIRMMHLAMTQQPGWVEQISARLPEVAPESRDELLDVTARVYVESQRRVSQRESQPLTPEGLRLPIRREPEVEASRRPFPASVLRPGLVRPQ